MKGYLAKKTTCIIYAFNLLVETYFSSVFRTKIAICTIMCLRDFMATINNYKKLWPKTFQPSLLN